MVGMAARAPVSSAVAALRRGREALVELDGQLDEALVWVRDPKVRPDRTAPDRLARTALRAGQALTSLTPLTPSHAIY
jgi:hypothetical protein